jgi:AcrR family transcriptional regulator
MSDARDFIINKAACLFIANSYEAVSISDISNAIGFTKGALYHHFKNKEELFKAVIDKHLIIQEIEFDEENGTLLQFNKVCLLNASNSLQRLVSNAPRFEIINYMSLIADGFRRYPGFADKRMKFMNDETEKIKRILNNAIEKLEIRSDIDTTYIAQIYFSMMLGLTGPIIQNQSIEEAIQKLEYQMNQMYLLLKI